MAAMKVCTKESQPAPKAASYPRTMNCPCTERIAHKKAPNRKGPGLL
jgi:hypothetical protein